MQPFSTRAVAGSLAAVLVPLTVAVTLATSPPSGASGRGPDTHGWNGRAALDARTVLSGGSLTHTFTVAGTSTTKTEPLSDPDDITLLGRDIFVGFQNGVGPQGQVSAKRQPGQHRRRADHERVTCWGSGTSRARRTG